MTYICYDDELASKFTRRKLATIERANQIIADYKRQGYTLSLRQVYYQFVARDLIENTEKSYKNLGNAINDGRMAGLIPWDGIEDRGRGINAWQIEEDEHEVLRGIEWGLCLDFWERQDTYVEVWVEKDALSSVIQRPCDQWRVPYMPCKGYLSASEAWRAGRRFMKHAENGRQCVMIHLGDHDPSGIDMTRDNSDRLEIFAEQGIEVRRIALNMDQIEQYRPPENPAKLTDTRATEYINRFGYSSWELDALEPRILHELIDNEIRTLISTDLWDHTEREEKQRRRYLSQLHDRYDDICEFLDREPE